MCTLQVRFFMRIRKRLLSFVLLIWLLTFYFVLVDTGLRLTHEQFGGRASCGAWFVSDELDCIIPSGSDDNFYGDPLKCCTDFVGHGTCLALVW